MATPNLSDKVMKWTSAAVLGFDPELEKIMDCMAIEWMGAAPWLSP